MGVWRHLLQGVRAPHAPHRRYLAPTTQHSSCAPADDIALPAPIVRKVLYNGEPGTHKSYHVVLTANAAKYVQWQCRVMYYWCAPILSTQPQCSPPSSTLCAAACAIAPRKYSARFLCVTALRNRFTCCSSGTCCTPDKPFCTARPSLP